MTHRVYIAGTGTAVPAHVVTQQDVRSIVEALFHERMPGLDRLLQVFEHTHIASRHFVCPPEWYAQQQSWITSTEVYRTSAIDLATEAARQALDNAAVNANELTGIVVVSTTGIMTPSLDTHLVFNLGMSVHAKRIPIFGLGCAGGVSGLARAAEACRLWGGGPVLFVAVEICTATFLQNDTSKSNIIAASLFADGAGAVVLHTEPTDLEVVAGHSTLFPETEDIMGWDVSERGLKVRFSRDIPHFIDQHLPRTLHDACMEWDITLGDIQSFITHPGGFKVLEAYAAAVGRPVHMFDTARSILQRFGNMSSASVLFVLDSMRRHGTINTGYALMSALGPGFSAEQLLLRSGNHGS